MTAPNDPLKTFCRQVRARSVEHGRAIHLLHGGDVTSQVVAVLRQELDSLVRLIYLLSVKDQARRAALIQASVNGKKWKAEGKGGAVTDREMVELAQQFHGWTKSVYLFGCAFIHLSSLHDHRERDPLRALPDPERRALLGHIRYYHGGPPGDDPTFADVVPYLPSVFHKIASNLEGYVKSLEKDEDYEP